MYHSNGNFEAFYHPKKVKDIEKKHAYIVGGGLAGLASAAFLVRDTGMPGENVHIFEELSLPGGSMDGIFNEQKGYIIRGGREMESHFETLWDLFRSIPSLEEEDASVLDEFYRLNKKDPSYSYARIIEHRGQRLATDGKLLLTKKDLEELLDLIMTPEDQLQNVEIRDVFSKSFFESNFWLYWATMFAFEPWQSAMEMRRYLMRFSHLVDTITDMSGLKFTKYNQYESLIQPLIHYLTDHGVQFQYNTVVNNVIVNRSEGKKYARKIELTHDGTEEAIELSNDDYVFVTNGSITENTTYGSSHSPAPQPQGIGASWQLWENLAKQDDSFGHPKAFYANIPKANWKISATLTFSDDRIVPYIEKICNKDPHSGSIVTSGPVTIKDSNWLLGFSISRQPHFHSQKDNELIIWLYGLFSDKKGNYIAKNMVDCTGKELTEEFLYHIGVPESDIPTIAKDVNAIPCHMPYITSYFAPRTLHDRPKVVPENTANLAFIGNFAETERDTVFTTEYSVRTAMEAVYTLFNVDRGVPEVWASCFDVRVLLKALYSLTDDKKLTEMDLPLPLEWMTKEFTKKIKGTYMEELLKESKLL